MSRNRWFLGLTLFLLVSVIIQTILIVRSLFIKSVSPSWLALWGIWGGAILLTGILFLRDWQPDIRRFLDAAAIRYQHSLVIRVIQSLFVFVLALVTPIIVLLSWPYPFDNLMEPFMFRLLVFWICLFLGAVLLKIRWPQKNFTFLLGALAVPFALVYRLSMYLPEVSASPFALGWSEGSHFYYSALFLSEKIYGQAMNWPILNPSRYLLQTVPFLLGSQSIWIHRAWQVVLSIVFPLWAAILLALRLKRKQSIRLPLLLLVAYLALFLLQGPIYYHLFGALLLVVWGTDTQNFRRTAWIVALASVWTGISRINWMPLPAVLAGAFYLLEQRRNAQSFWNYFRAPILWGVIGLVANFMSQVVYIQLSGQSPDKFGASLTSDLLWYRLLPNATYGPGIFLGSVLLALPPLLILFYLLRGRLNKFDPWSLAGLAGLLAVFYIGGLVVSVKIGGSSDLHNLDGFIVLLLVIVSYLFTDSRLNGVRIPVYVQVLAVMVPVLFSLSVARSLPVLSLEDARNELGLIRQTLDELAPNGEEIVFLTERQLFTFGEMDGLPLVEPYEKVHVMEMVMAGNQAYLDRFQEDISSRRFYVIVSEKLQYRKQPRTRRYSDENNQWDEQVVYWLMCYYDPVVDFPLSGVQILVPGTEETCPGPLP